MDKKTYCDRLLSDVFHSVNDINFDGEKVEIYRNDETKTYNVEESLTNKSKR